VDSTVIASYDPESHVYTEGGVEVPSVTQVLKLAGLSDYSDIPVNILETAAARGTALHEATALLDQDNLDLESVDPAIAGYLLSYQRWKELTADWTILEIEQWGIVQLGDMSYGRTIDRRLMEPGGAQWVVDIKTSSKKAAWWAIQLAAYAENSAWRRAVVHCFKDGTPAKLIEYEDDKDFIVWEAALQIAYWKLAK
jgi:hypothetical protein